MRSSMHADPKSIILISAGLTLSLKYTQMKYNIRTSPQRMILITSSHATHLVHNSIFSGFKSQCIIPASFNKANPRRIYIIGDKSIAKRVNATRMEEHMRSLCQ